MSLRLYLANASPFALKVVILARELNVFSKLTLDYSVAASPLSHTTPHSSLVPNGKIPALIVDETNAIYGSANICAYLVEIAEKKPTGYAAQSLSSKYDKLTTEACADAIMESVLLVRYERLSRPEDKRWPEWVDGQLSKVKRSIPVLAGKDLPDPSGTEILGPDAIAVAISLWYTDKRAPDTEWRKEAGGDKLDTWCKAVMERASWKETTFGM